MPNLLVGQSYDATITTSDGSTLPAGALQAASSDPSVSVGTPDANNVVKVTAVGLGTAVITYSATKYVSVMDNVSVLTPAALVLANGPIS